MCPLRSDVCAPGVLVVRLAYSAEVYRIACAATACAGPLAAYCARCVGVCPLVVRTWWLEECALRASGVRGCGLKPCRHACLVWGYGTRRGVGSRERYECVVRMC